MDDDLYGGANDADDRIIGTDPHRCTGAERTANREAAKLYNDGYRVGKAHEEERLMQAGFDSGFARGVIVGKLCGELYGACRTAAAADPSSIAAMARLEQLIFEDLPALGDNNPLDDAWLQELRAVAETVSPAAAAEVVGRLKELQR